MVNYSYVKPKLDRLGKTANDYIQWLSDERKNHKLPVLKKMEAVIIERNCGGGSEIHINYELKDNFNEFLKQH